MYKIGEFSKLAKITVKTLRFYDKEDIFKPSYIADNGYRYYQIDDIYKIQQIIEYRSIGLSLSDIKDILSGKELSAILEKQKTILENSIMNARSSISTINTMLASAKKGDYMQNYTGEIRTIPSYNVYYRHGIIDNMSKLVDFVLEAGADAKKHNPTIECANYCYVTYEAEEYQENNVELEYVEAVCGIANEGEITKSKTIPETKVLVIEHIGSYEYLREAYAYALEYVKSNNLQIVGKIREVYIHGCWDSEEKDYLTEIQVPIL